MDRKRRRFRRMEEFRKREEEQRERDLAGIGVNGVSLFSSQQEARHQQQQQQQQKQNDVPSSRLFAAGKSDTNDLQNNSKRGGDGITGFSSSLLCDDLKPNDKQQDSEPRRHPASPPPAWKRPRIEEGNDTLGVSFGDNIHVPGAFGMDRTKASPSSSVSFSQSPGKLAKMQDAKEESSDDEIPDLVALARRRIEAQQKKKEQEELALRGPARLVAEEERKAPPAERKQHKSNVFEDSDADEKQKASTRKQQSAILDDSDDEFRPRARKQRSFLLEDTDDEEDFSFTLPTKRPARKTAADTSSPSSSADATGSSASRTPRNPLTRMRLEAESGSGNRGFGARGGGGGLMAASSSSPPVAASSGDPLWSDDDDELVINANPKKKTSSNKQQDAKKKPAARKKNANNNNNKNANNNINNSSPPVPSFSPPNGIQQDEDVIDDDEMERLKQQLFPEFDEPKFGPFEFVPFKLGGDDKDTSEGDDQYNADEEDDRETFEVPASINRYLPNYQQDGIEFIFNILDRGWGGILGDDMGLGKTIQSVALLAALFKKTGTEFDSAVLKRRRKHVIQRLGEMQRAKEEALREGKLISEPDIASELDLPAWVPVLIIVPPTVVQNWLDDFARWGHFGIATFCKASDRENGLEQIRHGAAEVLVMSRSLFMQEHNIKALDEIDWKLIIVDEFHIFKNKKGHLANNLRELRDSQRCQVVGLTGTLMQNDHEELWNLVDLVQKDYLGDWKSFEAEFAHPIKLSRAKDADEFTKQIGLQKRDRFSNMLHCLFLQRKKEVVLGDELPEKDERIVFCELSPLQKRIYTYIIEQPDFLLLKHANGPCECGVNTKFFQEYQSLTSKAQRIEYQRTHRKEIAARWQCCYTIPKDDSSADGIDPRAVLWRQLDGHEGGTTACKRCPFCLMFPALHVLYKLSSHSALLQAKTPPDTLEEGTKSHQKSVDELERAKVFLPEDILDQLPGGSYIREDSVLDDHFSLSGKMKVLDQLLRAISRQQGRVLLFSASTQTLDLIENYARTHYSYLRMDGSTPANKRQEIANDFKKENIFLFLLSTKAMGLGLNLVEADNVIIFDVEWNPSNDAQAQDRAYRIGQKKDVKVFRLVSRGTVEELKYLRQVYKTQLKNETIVDAENLARAPSERRFRGIAGDKDRKGELFGMVNLLKYKDGTFMEYGSSSNGGQYGAGVHHNEDVLATVQDLSEEDFEEIGGGGGFMQAFEDIANRTELDPPVATRHKRQGSDVGDSDTELGGQSQVNLGICERAKVPVAEDEDDDDKLQSIPEQKTPIISEARGNAGDETSADRLPNDVLSSQAPPVDVKAPENEPLPVNSVSSPAAQSAISSLADGSVGAALSPLKHVPVKETPTKGASPGLMEPAKASSSPPLEKPASEKAGVKKSKAKGATTFSALDLPLPKKKSNKKKKKEL